MTKLPIFRSLVEPSFSFGTTYDATNNVVFRHSDGNFVISEESNFYKVYGLLPDKILNIYCENYYGCYISDCILTLNETDNDSERKNVEKKLLMFLCDYLF